MKIAIISDIHANLAALNAFPGEPYDAVWCIGDLVDYGPRPHEVIQEIRNRLQVTVCGNHDYAAGSSASTASALAGGLSADQQSKAYTLFNPTPEDATNMDPGHDGPAVMTAGAVAGSRWRAVRCAS